VFLQPRVKVATKRWKSFPSKGIYERELRKLRPQAAVMQRPAAKEVNLKRPAPAAIETKRHPKRVRATSDSITVSVNSHLGKEHLMDISLPSGTTAGDVQGCPRFDRFGFTHLLISGSIDLFGFAPYIAIYVHMWPYTAIYGNI